ncbi:hypothetical protein EG329_012251 [Mollisiaceae sp. DMI_Dod_QoI]|nr:hypothetical protein EG329_012251 [Helotiales sp. DMI_Dod_QoI]
MAYSAGSYTQYWATRDRPRTNTFVNNKEVNGEDPFSIAQPATIEPAPSALSKFEKVKQQLRESAQTLNTIFDKAQGKFKFKLAAIKQANSPTKHYARVKHDFTSNKHNDASLYGSSLDLAVPAVNYQFNGSDVHHPTSFRGLGHSLGRKISFGRPIFRERQLKDMTALPYQRPAIPDTRALLTSEQLVGIEAWASETVSTTDSLTPNQDDSFRVLTTSELLRLEGERIDTIELVRQYICPPNSPRLDGSDPTPVNLAGLQLDFDDLAPFLDEPVKTKRKDLINYLGHSRNASFHLVAGSATSYDAGTNLSDYYEVQLVEPQTVKKVLVKEIVYPTTRTSSDIEEDDDSEDSDIDRGSFRSFMLDHDSLLFDPDENQLVPPPSYPPSQALVLFLHGKGMAVVNLVEMLGQLDEDFINQKKSNSWGGVRFPEHMEWSDDWVARVGQVCGSKKAQKVHRWDSLLSKGTAGKMYGLTYRLSRRAMKASKMKDFVEHTVENHFWWRLCFKEQRHPKLF